MSSSSAVNPSPPRTEAAELAITPEVLQRWQSELQTFFSATRRRLGELHAALPVAVVTDTRPQRPPTTGGDAESIAAAPASQTCGAPADRLQELKRRLAAQLANE